MKQRNFDFGFQENNSPYLDIPEKDQQLLIDLMALLIIHLFQSPIQECENDKPSP